MSLTLAVRALLLINFHLSTPGRMPALLNTPSGFALQMAVTSHGSEKKSSIEFKLNIFIELIKWFMHLFNPFVAHFWCERNFARAPYILSSQSSTRQIIHIRFLFRTTKKPPIFVCIFDYFVGIQSTCARWKCCYVPLEAKTRLKRRTERERDNAAQWRID